jgi:hypothetical protein
LALRVPSPVSGATRDRRGGDDREVGIIQRLRCAMKRRLMLLLMVLVPAIAAAGD